MGLFCHNCGQENIEPKESVWHLVSHFFQDITHFGVKFFTSLKDLIIKPGFLSKEYMIGRRVRYLNPIRMYLFTSAIFFLIFFSLYAVGKLKSTVHWEWLNFLSAIFVLSMFFYFYKALRNFYKQRRAKTILKYLILLLMFFFTTGLTFVIFFFFSIFGL